MNLATVLRSIQPHHQEWCERNFGTRPPLMPYLGLVEEFGELHEALTNHGDPERRRADERDALGDCCIFALDYATKSGFNIADILLAADAHASSLLLTAAPIAVATIALGKMAHAELKSWQGIRGTPEQHKLRAAAALGMFLIAIDHYASSQGWTLADVVAETWSTVKHRDWTANKTNGVTA